MNGISDRELGIKEIGNYLLKGWTMTNDHCTNCQLPLMKHNKVVICTICSKQEQTPVETFIKKESDSDIASKRIGEYMLKGWTLIQQQCPNCPGIPLVENKTEKVKYCVLCTCSIDALHSLKPIPKTESPSDIKSKDIDEIETCSDNQESFNDTKDALQIKIAMLTNLLISQTHSSDIKATANAISSCAEALMFMNKI